MEVRALTDWPGYEVTDDGRVFSSIRYARREMTQKLNGVGYPAVGISRGGKRVNMAVHRLVAAAFLPPRPSPSHEIRHLNGERTDNRAGNLAWGTRAENAADRDAHGRTPRGAAHSEVMRRVAAAQPKRVYPEEERQQRRELAIRIGLAEMGRAAQRDIA